MSDVTRPSRAIEHRTSLVAIEVCEPRRLLSAGALDTTFASGGTLTLPGPSDPPSVIVQSNGLIDLAAVGKVRQLEPNGSLNTAYGNAGIANASGTRLLLQTNNDLIVIGEGNVTRLTPAGQLDSSFAGGKGTESIGGASSGTLQSDGKILVLGRDSSGNPALYRLNSDGSMDMSYGTNGVASLTIPGFIAAPSISEPTSNGHAPGAVAVDASSRAVVALAVAPFSNSAAPEFVVIRLTTNGVRDTTFDQGQLPNDGGDPGDSAGSSSVVVAPNGTIYLASNYEPGQGDDAAIITAFDGNGQHLAGGQQGNGQVIDGGILSLTVQPDNKLLATGYDFNQSDTRLVVMRLLPVSSTSTSLQRDPSFNGGTDAHIDYTTPDPSGNGDRGSDTGDFGWSIALQPDGKILVAGRSFETDQGSVTTDEVTLARLTADAGSTTTGSVSGTFFYDGNHNGIWDTGETPSPSWGVYIDANNDGKYDTGDTEIIANGHGQYIFSNLAAGAYIIRGTTASGWTQTYPASGGAQTVTLSAGQAATGINFGEYHGTINTTSPGSISGTFFYDSNANGTWDSGEPISPYWGVYIDANNDAKYDAGDTEIIANAKGQYAFANLAPGTYIIRGTTASGWTQTSPANRGAQIITVSSGQAVTGINFGEYHGIITSSAKGSISGTFFYDGNENGIWDAGEAPSPSWGVYIDANDDGVFDTGDTKIIANAHGQYTFGNLAAGTYVIRATTASGWRQTDPANGAAHVITLSAGQNLTGINFGEFHG